MLGDENTLYISEELNALDSLEWAVKFIQETKDNTLAWKWVVLSLNNALYEWAICACKGTNYENVLTKGRKLISFWEAINRCKNPEKMKMTASSKHLKLTSDQEESIKMLHDVLRNNLEHFIPKNWFIGIGGFPKIASDVLEIIRFLALESGNYIKLTYEERGEVEKLVSDGLTFLSENY